MKVPESQLSDDILTVTSPDDRRYVERIEGVGLLPFPLRFELHRKGVGEKPVFLKLINFHHRGACFQVPDSLPEVQVALEEWVRGAALRSSLGQRVLKENLRFRVCWSTFEKNRMFGVEFLDGLSREHFPVDLISGEVVRAERIDTPRRFAPVVTFLDPVDPHRVVYAQLLNLSKSGWLLSTSLTNKHLVAGMTLNQVTLTIPGLDCIKNLSLKVENTRHSEEDLTFYLGVSHEGQSSEQVERTLGRYFSLFSEQLGKHDEQPEWLKTKFSQLKKAGYFQKKWKNSFTFRVVSDERDYRKVLELRHQGYLFKGKTEKDATWRSQGEGLKQEGTILGAFWGGQLVASLELRFATQSKELRSIRFFSEAKLREALAWNVEDKGKKFVEINKLVVHPELQGTDAVVGLFQKAHSLVISNDPHDVLIAATDALVPLYERIGFRGVGVKAAHPVVQDCELHLLVLERKTYIDLHGIHPYAWSVVFEITRSHWAQYGLIQPAKKTLYQKWLTRLAKAWLGRKARGMSSEEMEQSPSRRVVTASKEIPTRWTRQEMAAEVIWPYILAVDEKVGKSRTDRVLDQLGIPRVWFQTQGNWISVEFLDSFMESVNAEGVPLDWLSERAGILAISPEVLGLKYPILRNFISPEMAFKAMQSVLPKMNRTRNYELQACRPGFIRVAIAPKVGHSLPKHSESCLNWKACFSQYLVVMEGQVPDIRKLSCCYKGDSQCTWEIRWSVKKRLLGKGMRLGTNAAGLSSSAWLLSQQMPLQEACIVSGLGLASFNLLRLWQLERRKRLESAQEFEHFESDSQARYQELQVAKRELETRYQELGLLEEAAVKILRNKDLREILSSTLDGVCREFEFNRAFSMLVDSNGVELQTAAIAGMEGDLSALWAFRVDLRETRESPFAVSSVFRSGRPVLIANVSDHFDRMNESSRKLIHLFGIHRFMVVPIPGQNGNWGVILADRGKQGELKNNDLELLARVARQLGLALDKHSALESERQRSALFRKFVPAYERTQLMQKTEAHLGWEVRETVALFVDIRRYTETTGVLPPHAIAALVNGFYGLVHRVGREYGGYTDKFIGDAALVTWGYIDQNGLDSKSPIQCALAILSGVDELNRDYATLGIPPIQIGIGIHRGPAVCGLFGCEDRMDFTGVGSTANTASRLQSLSKDLGASICVSEAVFKSPDFEKSELPSWSEWRFKEGVQLRGVKDSLRIAFLPRNKSPQKGEAA